MVGSVIKLATKFVTAFGITSCLAASAAFGQYRVDYGEYEVQETNIVEDKAWKSFVEPALLNLDAMIPDFSIQLRAALKNKPWFLINRRPIRCPLQFAHVVKENKEVCQDNLTVQIHKPWFSKLKREERAELILNQGLRALGDKQATNDNIRAVGFVVFALATHRPPSAEDIQHILFENKFGRFATAQEKISARTDYELLRDEYLSKYCKAGSAPIETEGLSDARIDFLQAVIRVRGLLIEKSMSIPHAKAALAAEYRGYSEKLFDLVSQKNEGKVCQVLNEI